MRRLPAARVRGEAVVVRRANLSETARRCLQRLGVEEMFHHALATLRDPAYREANDGAGDTRLKGRDRVAGSAGQPDREATRPTASHGPLQGSSCPALASLTPLPGSSASSATALASSSAVTALANPRRRRGLQQGEDAGSGAATSRRGGAREERRSRRGARRQWRHTRRRRAGAAAMRQRVTKEKGPRPCGGDPAHGISTPVAALGEAPGSPPPTEWCRSARTGRSRKPLCAMRSAGSTPTPSVTASTQAMDHRSARGVCREGALSGVVEEYAAHRPWFPALCEPTERPRHQRRNGPCSDRPGAGRPRQGVPAVSVGGIDIHRVVEDARSVSSPRALCPEARILDANAAGARPAYATSSNPRCAPVSIALAGGRR